MLFGKLLRRIVKTGTIELIGPDGASDCVAATPSPNVAVRIKSRKFLAKLMTAPSFFLAEGYVNGDLVIEQGDLRQLLTVLMSGVPDADFPIAFDKLRHATSSIIDWIVKVGTLDRARRDVQFHYDLSNEFFALFLDRAMQYSCAYFETGKETLAEAQTAKMQHIAAKLALRPGQKVLDIGCGWGGLAAFLSSNYDRVHVTGVTLSKNQHAYATEKRRSPQLDFRLQDYRLVSGPFDRIVSVGMLEHVGKGHYKEYFAKVRDLLADDGVALIHTIGRRGPPSPINPWIRRRIFPGAYLPSLSQLAAAAERTGLWILDCENLRLHYAKTLYRWYVALQAHRREVEAQFGEPFYRAWEFYLLSCEAGFLYSGLSVFQLLLGKTPDAAPLTRDFMFKEELALKKRYTGESDFIAGAGRKTG
jgi:cyclopropane-fatty-acyl-phospholipid synthase